MILYRYDPFFFFYCGVFTPMPHQINDTQFDYTTTKTPPIPIPYTIIKFDLEKQDWYYEEEPKSPDLDKNPMDDELDYVILRQMEYPPMVDYLDGLVKNNTNQMNEYIGKCLAIKQKIPKDTKKTRRQYLIEKIGMRPLKQNA